MNLTPNWWARLLLSAMISLMTSIGLAAAQNDYVIGIGDQLNITVFGELDLSPTLRVTERGSIPYPFLGEIEVTGLTTAELEARLLAGLKGPYLIDPKIAVTIDEYRAFYVNGQVRKPGGYGWEPGMTIQKAVTLAGGLTDRASQRKLFLLSEEAAQSGGEAVRVDWQHPVGPGDIVTIEESFF